MFTGLLVSKRAGVYRYLVFDGGGTELRSGRPPAARLRREVAFEDLPDGARREVLETYCELWGIGLRLDENAERLWAAPAKRLGSAAGNPDTIGS